MPYLTPDEIPEDDECRPLFIPASTAWLAIVSGALTELTQEYNWEQEGSVTVEQAVERMQAMVEQYYADACGECTLPGGGKIIRIGEGGFFEEACGSSWCPPSGDYAVPSVPARSDPTSEERICLAAMNAANVLAQVYETMLDDYESLVDWQIALTGFVSQVVSSVGLAMGLLTSSFLGVVSGIFAAFYGAFEFLTEDVWDAEFTDKLICILVACATDDAGVVTFDYDCFMHQLQFQTDISDPSFSDIRRLGQVWYILQFIGADGLNLAGATTAITVPDCDHCLPNCAGFYDFEVDEQGWLVQPSRGTYVTGQYFQDTASGLGYDALTIRLYCNPMHVGVNGFEWVFSTSGAAGVNVQSFRQSDDSLIRTLYTSGSVNTGGAFTTYIVSTSGYDETVPFFFQINITMATGGVMRIRSVEITE